jgi:hypothetical protein
MALPHHPVSSPTAGDGRLHDARHTAATVLMILDISGTAVDKVTGWEPGERCPAGRGDLERLGKGVWG